MKKSFIIFLHVGYWFLYLLLVIMIVGALRFRMSPIPGFKEPLLNHPLFMMVTLPNIFAFYGCYTWVFSNFLKKNRPVLLVGACILVAVISASIGCVALFIKHEALRSLFYQSDEIVSFISVMSLIALVHGGIALIIRGFIAWYENLKINEALTKKNFEMEMTLIKSKLDPHFLFNTINNIDVLIGKDAVKASDFLNKLSDILRFMLYETKTESISLQKEWEYLEKYIELQKIRSANPSFVEYSIEGNIENVMIAPMTLIPFVENAFKHGEKVKSDKAIVIKLSIENNTIHFECKNKYLPNFKEKNEYNGLGNELIHKRLLLLYPNRHTLVQKIENEIFSIQLSISNE